MPIIRILEFQLQNIETSLSTARKNQLGDVKNLKDFLSKVTGNLILVDLKIIVDQALTLFEQCYVHLPLKKAMHAVDPLQRLRLIQFRLDKMNSDDMIPELDFHEEMLDIFNSVRDLHTNYMLPRPFSDNFAFLPFLLESYWKENKRQFIITKIDKGFEKSLPPSFKPGVHILYWNGIPIQRAVEINANKIAGSNTAARFARGLERMTNRPMRTTLPPDEVWVVIGYKTEDSSYLEYKQPWLVSPQLIEIFEKPKSVGSETLSKIGLDLNNRLNWANEKNPVCS